MIHGTTHILIAGTDLGITLHGIVLGDGADITTLGIMEVAGIIHHGIIHITTIIITIQDHIAILAEQDVPVVTIAMVTDLPAETIPMQDAYHPVRAQVPDLATEQVELLALAQDRVQEQMPQQVVRVLDLATEQAEQAVRVPDLVIIQEQTVQLAVQAQDQVQVQALQQVALVQDLAIAAPKVQQVVRAQDLVTTQGKEVQLAARVQPDLVIIQEQVVLALTQVE
jgi:hypothetical protein